MAKARACGANGAKGGHGRSATGKSVTEFAKAINARVCGHARDGDMQGLLDYAASQRDHMNHVNLTTAMHKLAQLAKDGGVADHLGDWRFAVLHDRVQMALELQSGESLLPGAEVLPRCWATLAWSYATLGVPGPCLRPIFGAIAELSVPNLGAFNPVEFTNLVWAFAKAQVPDAAFFEAARAHAARSLAHLSAQNLSTLVWALVTAQHHQAGILCKLAEKFIWQMGAERVDPVAVSNLMWGLATAKVHPKPALLQRAGSSAAELLPAFKPQELSITAWAFSRLGVRHDRLFGAVAERLCRDPDLRRRMHAQGLANLMWAFNRQRALGGAGAQLAPAMQAMLPRCVALLGQFKAQELSCVCKSLQESGVQRGACREAAAFWDTVAASEVGHAQAHGDPGTLPRRGHRKLSEAALETASTGTGGSSPYAHSDAGSQDGDGLGMLGSDVCGGDTAGGASAPCAADHSKGALDHGRVPLYISVDTKVAAADDAKQVLQLPHAAKQVSPVPPFQREAPRSLGTLAPPGDRSDVPGQCETAEGGPSCVQSRPQQEAGGANLLAGLSFENQVCYIVKNTFIEEAEAGHVRGPAATLYASEPVPARVGFTAGKLLTFPKLKQRPMYSK